MHSKTQTFRTIIFRNAMIPGQTINGPAILCEETATTVIEVGWKATLTKIGDCILTRAIPRKKQEAIGTQVDPVMLEVFNNLYYH